MKAKVYQIPSIRVKRHMRAIDRPVLGLWPLLVCWLLGEPAW